jgi:hypothetical protein
MTPRVYISIAGPKTGASLRVPVFPPPYDDRNAQPGDFASNVNATVMKVTGGWDKARPVVHRTDFTNYEWFDGDLSIGR